MKLIIIINERFSIPILVSWIGWMSNSGDINDSVQFLGILYVHTPTSHTHTHTQSDPLSSLAYPMITHIPLVAENFGC